MVQQRYKGKKALQSWIYKYSKSSLFSIYELVLFPQQVLGCEKGENQLLDRRK